MRCRLLSARRHLVLAVVGLAIAGCGDSNDLSGFTPPPITTTTPTSTIGTALASTTVANTASTAASPAPVPGSWTPITANLAGLPSECGNMTLLSVRPDRDMLIAGIALQGLRDSANGSDTWNALGTGAGSAVITNRPSSIVYDPDHPDTFWESGIYNGGGVYRTDDNGVTFRQLGDARHSDAVSVDFTDPARRTLLSGTHEQSTVLRSTDGGQTWTDLSGSLPDQVGFATGPFVIDAQTHLLGTNNGIYRTTDGGTTWTAVFKGATAGSPLVAKSDGAMYWALERSGGIVKSTDAGVTWTLVTRPGTMSPVVSSLVELPDGRLAAVGDQVVIISADHGATWRSVGPAMPYTPVGLAYSPFRNAFYIWYFGCDKVNDNPIPPDAIMSLGFDYKTQ